MNDTRTITVEALSAALQRVAKEYADQLDSRPSVLVERPEWVADWLFAALPAEPAAPEPTAEELIWARRQTLLEDAAAGRFAALPAEPAGAGLREAHNMLRRIIGAYRNPQADDPHALGDEIAGAEAFLRRATLAATPVGRLVCLEGTLMKDCAVTGCPTHDAATPEGK